VAEPAFERIAFVASRYPTLRGGVTRAVVATCILAGGLFDIFFNDRESGLLRAVVGLSNLFVVSAIGIVLMFRSRRWLDQRFGRVRSNNPFWGLAGLSVCQIGFFACSRLDDFYGSGSGYPSASFLFVAAVGIWFCVRLWPRSLHYFVPTLVAVGFALQYATLRGEQAIDSWEVMAYATTLVAWIAAGLVDLVILCKVLPRHAEGEAVSVDA
jgi:hypothetical protein